MKITAIQHTSSEVPGSLIEWAKSRRVDLNIHHIYLNESLPDLNSMDALIVLGGPMNIDQEQTYPWLVDEKKMIRDFLKTDKPYLGICLGGQLLAQVLGGEVRRNQYREIGWHSVHQKQNHPLFQDWPESFEVFQWHEDFFTLPPNCRSLMGNSVSEHQAYILGDRVVGLQFHPEATHEWIFDGYQNSIEKYDLSKEPFIHSLSQTSELTPQNLQLMKPMFFNFLDRLFKI